MLKMAARLGPMDHGGRMTLREFDHSEVEEGYTYELSRGVIVVSDVPRLQHKRQVEWIRNRLILFQEMNPGVIHSVSSGDACKILLWDYESERHPDISIYLTDPPEENEELWTKWIPEIVIEVVSPSSVERDYHLKPEEYFGVGVDEYWLFNADKSEATFMKRHGDGWRERILHPPETYKSRRLPGFVLDCAKVFKAAKER